MTSLNKLSGFWLNYTGTIRDQLLISVVDPEATGNYFAARLVEALSQLSQFSSRVFTKQKFLYCANAL